MSGRQVPSILAEILGVKREEVAEKMSSTSLAAIRAQARDAPPVRGFCASLEKHISAGESAIIAEIKKASPSRGVICADLDVAQTLSDMKLEVRQRFRC